MDQLLQALQTIVYSIKINSYFVFKIIGIFWLIHIINWSIRYQLNRLGIIPRTFRGFFGIFISPFLHGDFNHLLLNSVPLFVLSNLILLQGKYVYCYVSLVIIMLSGFAVWLFGKRATHIGASSIIMGYFGYMAANAYHQFTVTAIILVILCIYYFGGLIIMLFPGKKGISWEGHFFGFLSGIAAAYLCYLIK